MADQGEEIKIPVFSVLKNGIILKNIFLNNPQWESKLLSDLSSQVREDADDDPVLIGRHPDCHIVLDHPSISRFHLEIRAQPASQKLSVIDRSSVHGTWVSGHKIQPNVAVVLEEGDTVRLGASTRMYKLQWVPLSCAFEMENPLPALIEENEETHQLENLNEVWLEDIPSAPPIPESFSIPLEGENQCPEFCSAALMSESIGSSVFEKEENMNPEVHGNANEAQSERDYKSPLMTSGNKGKSLSILSRRSKSKLVSSIRIQTGRNKENMGERNEETDAVVEECKGEEPLCRVLFENEKENEEEETFISPLENLSPLSSMNQRSHTMVREILSSTSAILTMTEETTWSCEAPSSMKQTRPFSANYIKEEDEVHDSDKENLTPVVSSHPKPRKNKEEETFISPLENLSPLSSMNQRSHTRVRETLSSTSAILTMTEKSTWSREAPSSMKQTRPIPANYVKEEDEVNDSDNENLTPVVSSHPKLRKNLEQLQISSSKAIAALSDEEDAFFADKENWTPDIKSKKKLVHRDFQQFNGEEQREAFLSDKENMTREFSGSGKSKKPLPIDFYKVDGEEAFFSDKENVTPNASGVKTSKREITKSQARTEREIIERRTERIPFLCLLENSHLKNGSPLKHAQRTADNERTPFKSLIEKSPSKKCSPLSKENVPFQSLMESSPLKKSNHVINTQRTGDKGNNKCSSFTQTQKTEAEPSSSFSQSVDQVLRKAEENKRWIMVVDTGCCLNEESRKALQLLEGLKGTQLIIPRIVIRELDCLNRRESLFRKNRKVASSMLQWIEDCMVRSRSWIHVQSSLETIFPVAPTPPATPRSELGDGSDEIGIGASNPMAFSTCRSLMEIVSPTAEDHILDCALMFKGMKDDGQLVLLTDSVTLKIKAMAEGLLCEQPCEFRESLVNPYSKRFLWSDSIPRGPTWSCLDEVGAIEDYRHQLPNVRKTSKAAQSIKGLKLILLHNSLYGMTSTVN